MKKEDIVTDRDMILAVTTKSEFSAAGQRAVIDFEQLKKAVKLIGVLGWENISIQIETNQPILLAEYSGNEQKETKGVIIAPRVPEVEKK